MRASERDRESFELIETMRWSVEAGFWLLDYHFERLRRSAWCFGFACDVNQIGEALSAAVEPLDPAQRWRVRLALAHNGTIRVTSSQLANTQAAPSLPAVAISETRTDSANIFLYHKTTNRRLYDTEFSRVQSDYGCCEVLFCNQRGELTEGSRTNLFVEFDGLLHTPPLRCGLLDGTLRRSMLSVPHARVQETIVMPKDLKRADKILIGNSVIGLSEVWLLESIPGHILN